jgi:hypothetical protein
MQIQNVPITSVKLYEKNPRFNDYAGDIFRLGRGFRPD